MSKQPENRNVAVNRKAYHDYAVLERFEAGIVLRGTEVKSVRAGKATLTGSYVRITGNDAVIVGSHIAEYEQGNRFNHDPRRERRVLLHRKEILKLRANVEQKGYTVVPLALYFKRGLAKVELGLCKGKALHDKREAVRRKTDEREAERAIRAR